MQDSEHQPSDVHLLESSSKPAAALPTSTLEVLKAARELISDPARWTQKTSARDADGKIVMVRSESAVCFCSIGALIRVVGCRQIGPEMALEVEAGTGVSTYNDEHSHAEVLDMWDRAIAAAQTTAQPDVQGDAK